VQRIEHELERCQPLLPVDNCPRLHAPDGALRLLKDNRAKEMRVLPFVWRLQYPVGRAGDVIPKRLPLAFPIPNVTTLEERDHEPLWQHEDHLWRADQCFHWHPLAVG
jgi:hypothetical protein